MISCVVLGLVLGLTALLVLNNDASKVSVSFVNVEVSHGQFPSYKENLRFAFAVRNGGVKAAFIVVSAIEDENGNWVPSLQPLGEVEAGQSTQLYLYLPPGSRPKNLRVRVNESASAIQKSKFAVRLLIEKASGRYTGQQVWFDRLKVPAGEVIVSLRNGVESGATNEAHPVRSETNLTAAGRSGE